MKLYCETSGCNAVVANLPEGTPVKMTVHCPSCGETIYIYGTPGGSLVLDHERVTEEQKGTVAKESKK